jgi:hypothetical protein
VRVGVIGAAPPKVRGGVAGAGAKAGHVVGVGVPVCGCVVLRGVGWFCLNGCVRVNLVGLVD